MNIIVGSDHAGYLLRGIIANELAAQKHTVLVVGAESESSYDYPDASDAVCCAIQQGRADYGVLICGTGIGVSIRANRFHGIRAALCTSTTMAQLAVEHNHANVLCLGARITVVEEAILILHTFLSAAKDNSERHENRVQKLDAKLPC